MKKIMMFLLIFMLFGSNVYASSISDWAINDYKRIDSYGYLDKILLNGEFSDNITRLEFCKLIMNILNKYEDFQINDEDIKIFEDTEDIDVLMAYKSGIVNGVSDTQFNPDGKISREEMAVMISRMLVKVTPDFNKFSNQLSYFDIKYYDSEDTSSWAVDDLAAICYYEIISGVDYHTVQPKGLATKEQAICMLNRTVNVFTLQNEMYQIPKIKNVENIGSSLGLINISWSRIDDIKSYDVIIKRKGKENVIVNVPSRQNKINDYLLPDSSDGLYTIYICANLNNGLEIISEPYTLDTNIMIEQPSDNISDNIIEEEPFDRPQVNEEDELPDDLLNLSLTQKEMRVFPEGIYFETEEIAKTYMVEVTVPVWVIGKDNEKRTSKKTIMVNQALATDIINIFTEIYNDESKFPIKDVGGYFWRNTAGGNISQHSYGTCIDINYNENYYVKPDGTPITGSYWKPGEDPYSIAEDSIVVKTFAKYSWAWGGNAWGEGYNKDYMHFTYLGK